MLDLLLAAIDLRGEYILAFGVLMTIVIAFALYSRKGSGIDHHPTENTGGAPGAIGPGRMSAAEDETEGPLDTHGTQ